MGGYANGRFPLSMMVHLGGDHYLPAGTAARWQWLVRMALLKYGVLLVISPGWNGYRPYDVQVEYRKDLGIFAAVPGYSSHGLIYLGRLCAAIDVHNWAQLGWGRFKALCRLAGLTVDFVSPQELWHIGDFNDIWTIPEFTKEDDMPTTEEIWHGIKFRSGHTPGQLLVQIAESTARAEYAGKNFFKHGGKNVTLWIYVMPNGDFVRIRDHDTAVLYKERAGHAAVVLSTQAIRLLVADQIATGGRDLTGTIDGESETTKTEAEADDVALTTAS